MAYAGIDSFTELARLIDQDGLRERTLRKLADDDNDRRAQRRDLAAIAEATGLPHEFFTLTHDELVQALTGGGPELADRVTKLERTLEEAERQRQNDLASLYAEVARQVSLGLEIGSLPEAGGHGAKGSHEAAS